MKLTSYENPITGKKSNIMNLGSVWEKVFGVAVTLLIISGGQKVADTIENMTKGKLDASPQPLTSDKQVKQEGIRTF